MASYRFASRPGEGEAIAFEQSALKVPNNPIIPFIEGDGTGPDIWRASVRVFDAAVEKAYGGERKIAWMEVFAGEKAHAKHRRVAARRDARGVQGVPRLHQGTAHHAGRRRHPLAQRHAAPGARPLRLHPAGALLRGRRRPDEGAGEGEHRDLPREHGRRLRRHRVEGGLARGERAARVHPHEVRQGHPRELGDRHQADVGVRLEAAREHGHRATRSRTTASR